MLFSNDEIARMINDRFEPVWQSVRPVPVVRIDFGNGNVITRTLHGNVATYVCSADGEVLDVLPGLYEPTTYLEQLQQLELLARYHAQFPETAADELQHYHRQQGASLDAEQPVAVLAEAPQGFSIFGAEAGTRIVLQPAERLHSRSRMLRGRPPVREDVGSLGPAESLADSELLHHDTQINETVRRRMIHEYLAEHGLMAPSEMTPWLYREVLKADLDDPYLGLGTLLFGNYPFED